MNVRAQLGIRASLFMFRICEIVQDPRLTKATNIFWDESGLRNPERTHSFSCDTPNELVVPEWLHRDGVIRPSSLFIAFDTNVANYHIAQDFTEDSFLEVTLSLSSPFDIRHATWQAAVGDYSTAEDNGRSNTIHPAESIAQSTEDFGALISSIEFGLVSGTFVREDHT